MELYTELFYAIIQTLFLCFLLICYPYTSRYIFNVFYSLYISYKSTCTQQNHTMEECSGSGSVRWWTSTKEMNVQMKLK